MRIFGLLPRGLRKIFAEASHHACILPINEFPPKPGMRPSRVQAPVRTRHTKQERTLTARSKSVSPKAFAADAA